MKASLRLEKSRWRRPISWLVTYWTLPLALLALAGLLLDLRENPRPVLFLGVLVVLPVLAFAAVSTLWFPRYLVFVTIKIDGD